MSDSTTTRGSPTGGEFRSRMERKFFVQPRHLGLARALLSQVCRPDPEHPEGRINTLYFDTAELEQYTRSAAGEFRKDKIRIRWYGDTDSLAGDVPVYLELKSRRGFASSKRRHRMDAPAESLRQTQLRRGIIPRTEMVSRLAKFDYINPEPIFPVIRISYLRYRYTELMTGIRVSLDTAIGSRLVIPGMGFAEVDIRLRGGVVEIKGPTLELPETLRRIKLLDTEWSRFSKYNQCVDVHLTEPGEISRLWPTGCMVDP